MKSSEYNLNYQLPSRERKIPKKTINANPLSTTSSTYKPIATSPSKYKSSNDYKANYDIQSKKIFELTQYKNLCEELITKLLPTTKLPLTKSSVKALSLSNVDVANATSSYNKIEQLTKEKNDLAAALNAQHVLNDEQRNFIEILKQTLESSMIKNNMSLNEIITAAKESTNRENIQKEIDSYVNTIKALSNENTQLKKTNEDNDNAIALLKGKLEKEKENNERISSLLSQSNEDKAKISDDVTALKEQNESLKVTVGECQAMIAKYENELHENGQKMNEMNNSISSSLVLQKNYNENKALMNTLQFEYNKLSKEKNDADIQLMKSKEEISQLKKRVSDMMNEMDDKEEKHLKEKTNLMEANEKEKEKQKEIEIEMNNVKDVLHDRETKLIDLRTQLLTGEKANLNLQMENDSLKKKIDDTTSKLNMELAMMNDKNSELSSTIEKMKKMIDDNMSEIDSLNKTLLDVKEKYSKCLIESEATKSENENLKNLLSNATNQYEQKSVAYMDTFEKFSKLSIDYDNIKKEIPFWKNKYSTDIKEKTDNIITLKNTVDDLSNQIAELNAQLKQKSNSLSQMNKALTSYQGENESYQNKIKEYDDKLNDVLRTNEKLVLSLRDEKDKRNQIEQLTDCLNEQYRFIQIIFEKLNIENNKSISPLEKLKVINEYIDHINLHSKKNNEDINSLSMTNDNLIEKVEALEQDLTAYANKLKSANNYIEESENKLKTVYIDNVSLQSQANSLHNRIIMLNKEKKFLQDLIDIVVNTPSMRNVSSLVSKAMNVSDDINALHREKMKNWNNEIDVDSLERKINEKTNEYYHLCDLIKGEMKKSSFSDNEEFDRFNTVGSLRSISELERINTAGSFGSVDRSMFNRACDNNYFGKFK